MVTTDVDEFSREHGIGGFVVGSQIDAVVKGFLLGNMSVRQPNGLVIWL